MQRPCLPPVQMSFQCGHSALRTDNRCWQEVPVAELMLAARPLLVSLLLYLDADWPRQWDAETLFLDDDTDIGIVVRPKRFRAVLMDQVGSIAMTRCHTSSHQTLCAKPYCLAKLSTILRHTLCHKPTSCRHCKDHLSILPLS